MLFRPEFRDIFSYLFRVFFGTKYVCTFSHNCINYYFPHYFLRLISRLSSINFIVFSNYLTFHLLLSTEQQSNLGNTGWRAGTTALCQSQLYPPSQGL
jgi:hypothetical protein